MVQSNVSYMLTEIISGIKSRGTKSGGDSHQPHCKTASTPYSTDPVFLSKNFLFLVILVATQF